MTKRVFWLFLVTSVITPPSQAQGKILLDAHGAWSKQDLLSSHRKQSHQKVYFVPLEAGKRYLVDLRSSNDPYLFLEDESGNLLASNDDGGAGRNSRILFRPKNSGYHRIVATTFRGGTIGTFQLSVVEK